MTKKKFFYGMTGLVLQLAAIGFSFIPIIFKVLEYELDPYTGRFIPTGEKLSFNIFFTPGKYLGNTFAESYCDPGFAGVFSFLFLLAGLISAVTALVALIKKKRSLPALVLSIVAAVDLLISFFCEVTFRYDYLTWQHFGKLAFGAPVLLLLQLAAVVMLILSSRKK